MSCLYKFNFQWEQSWLIHIHLLKHLLVLLMSSDMHQTSNDISNNYYYATVVMYVIDIAISMQVSNKDKQILYFIRREMTERFTFVYGGYCQK